MLALLLTQGVTKLTEGFLSAAAGKRLPRSASKGRRRPTRGHHFRAESSGGAACSRLPSPRPSAMTPPGSLLHAHLLQGEQDA